MGRVSAELGKRVYLDTNIIIYNGCDSFLTNNNSFKPVGSANIKILSGINPI
jgi:hypothetical protein